MNVRCASFVCANTERYFYDLVIKLIEEFVTLVEINFVSFKYKVPKYRLVCLEVFTLVRNA